MNESNPYAPPQEMEVEAHYDRCWRLHGQGLLVKNGVTLPPIDLDSGVTENQTPLRVDKYSHQHLNFRFVVTMTIPIATFGFCKSIFHLNQAEAFLAMFVSSFLIGRLMSITGKGMQSCTIWLFTEERRHKRKLIRRYLRIAATVILILPIFGIKFIVGLPEMNLLLFGFMIWVCLFLALGIWSISDNPKFKTKQFSPGWLSISNIHPQALEYLRLLEAEELSQQALLEPPPIRRVRTMYFHRLPLRMLVDSQRNPLKILLIVLMKYLRSPRFERLFYDDSEASELTQSELSPTLLEACDRWLARHSDWGFVKATTLDSPLRDFQVETAILTTADRSSTLIIVQNSTAMTPHQVQFQNTILSWINDGEKFISTFDCPFLELKDAHLCHRASGTPQTFYEEHIRNLQGYPIYLPENITELRDLLNRRQRETNLLLEARKIQSSVVEQTPNR
jgi:hypothetical protein